MSTIKSSAENLTLNADGANNDIKFQSNGSEVASIDQAGTITATTFTGAATDATKLPLAGGSMTGVLNITKSGDGQTPLVLNTGNNETLSFYNDTEEWMIKSAENLHLTANNATAGGVMVKGGSSVDLYHNTSKKLETTATGVAVTGGVAIGGTGAANTLSDYEIGTWTPALISSGTNPTYSTNAGIGGIGGYYVKVGRLVTVWFDINVSISNIGDGTAIISGLPITPLSGVVNGGYSTVQWRSSSGFDIANGIPLTGWVHSNNYIYPEQQQNSGSSPMTYLTGTKRFTGMVVYQAD